MKSVEIGIFHAKTHLSEIIQRVTAGERFYITRRGKPVAVLGPASEELLPLERGCAKNGGYRMSSDFDVPLGDLDDYM